MLEKKGAAKQVFNFEEDEGQEMLQQGATNASKPEANSNTQAASKKPGRPRQNQGKQTYDDDEMEDEDAEY